MPRFYVKSPKGKWNIYSTIVDDLLFDNWVEFVDLEKFVCDELVEEKRKDLQTLLTNNPILNNMNYDDCVKKLKLYGRKVPID